MVAVCFAVAAGIAEVKVLLEKVNKLVFSENCFGKV
jgi:hypothetical protein